MAAHNLTAIDYHHIFLFIIECEIKVPLGYYSDFYQHHK